MSDEYSKRMRDRIRRADRAANLHFSICLSGIVLILCLATFGAYKLVF